MKREFTKKEEMRVLEKFIHFLHGEDDRLVSKVIDICLKLEWEGLRELKEKYKAQM
jgi:hypothetical protein